MTSQEGLLCRLLEFQELRIVKGLLFAPLENDDISVQHTDIAGIRLGGFDGSLEACERTGIVGLDFYPVSSFESELTHKSSAVPDNVNDNGSEADWSVRWLS